MSILQTVREAFTLQTEINGSSGKVYVSRSLKPRLLRWAALALAIGALKFLSMPIFVWVFIASFYAFLLAFGELFEVSIRLQGNTVEFFGSPFFRTRKFENVDAVEARLMHRLTVVTGETRTSVRLPPFSLVASPTERVADLWRRLSVEGRDSLEGRDEETRS